MFLNEKEEMRGKKQVSQKNPETRDQRGEKYEEVNTQDWTIQKISLEHLVSAVGRVGDKHQLDGFLLMVTRELFALRVPGQQTRAGLNGHAGRKWESSQTRDFLVRC